jgi:micrococcal nuclease
MRLARIALISAIALIVLFKVYLLLTIISHGADFLACEVTKIVDGDTLYCEKPDKNELKIRLIGIDAPESYKTAKAYRDAERSDKSIEKIKEMGDMSKAYISSMIKTGDRVTLELDVQTEDKYGRTLAYIYLPDGSMLNELMVKEGYAKVMTIPPNVKYQERFIEAEKYARENQRGIWSE